MGACMGSMQKLSKEDLQFLQASTHYDEATIMRWYEGFREDCPNGRLTPAKFVSIHELFFPSRGNVEQFCDHVFRTFDMDKNGYIDFNEFLLAVSVTSAGTPEEKLRWAFRMCDVDGNGVIDLQEMTKIVQAIRHMLGMETPSTKPEDSSQEQVKVIFKKMDENGDGMITQEEFIQGCMQDEELSKMLNPLKPMT